MDAEHYTCGTCGEEVDDFDAHVDLDGQRYHPVCCPDCEEKNAARIASRDATITAQAAEIKRLRAENEQLTDALELVQWAGSMELCPLCDCYPFHVGDCPVGLALHGEPE